MVWLQCRIHCIMEEGVGVFSQVIMEIMELDIYDACGQSVVTKMKSEFPPKGERLE